MGQEQRATSGAAVTVIVVIAVIAILLFLGLLVLGLGAFFFVRTEARQVQQAEVMQMEAMAQLEKAKAESERVRATQAQMPLESAAAARIVVTIDAQSQLSVDGQMVTRDELRERISARISALAQNGWTSAVEVKIEVAETVPFKAVADIQSLCRELGIRLVEVRAAEPEAPTDPAATES